MTRGTLPALLAALLPGTFCIAAAHPAPVQVEPKAFAEQVINAPAGVDCLTFTPDGNTVYFDREAKAAITIMFSRRAGGTWSTPQVAPFSGTWLDHDPVVAPDGSFLVYTSNRPDNADGQPVLGGRLWRVDRRGGGWGAPVRLPDVVNATTHTYAPAIAANGDVYYQQSNPPDQDFRLYRTAYRNGSYQAPEQLALGDPAAHKLDPAIAPDASFIVFDANYAGKGQPDRLFIAFREGNRWSSPVDMGDALNLYRPWGSHLGPDRQTLYFTSDHALPGHPVIGQPANSPTRSGINHIWSISLAPWLRAHRQRSGGAA